MRVVLVSPFYNPAIMCWKKTTQKTWCFVSSFTPPFCTINCIVPHIVHFWLRFRAVLWTKIRLLPASSIRRCSSPGWRKASSLHERICVPTRSELVASILALSSFRLTPAMEATSLMSSSSLSSQRSGKGQQGVEIKTSSDWIRLD